MTRSPISPIGLLVLVAACAGPSDPAPVSVAPPPTTVAAAPVPPPSTANGPTVPATDVHVSAPACAYGGSAPAVTVFVDVTTARALTGVTMSFTLTDSATGAPSGVSSGYESITISPVDRGLLDFSTQGTTPFGGTLAAGTTTRLEYFAGVGTGDPTLQLPAGAFGGPLRVSVVLRANEGVFTATCDTAQMLPSS